MDSNEVSDIQVFDWEEKCRILYGICIISQKPIIDAIPKIFGDLQYFNDHNGQACPIGQSADAFYNKVMATISPWIIDDYHDASRSSMTLYEGQGLYKLYDEFMEWLYKSSAYYCQALFRREHQNV